MNPEPYTVMGSPTAISGGSILSMRGTGSHVPITLLWSSRIAHAGHVPVSFSQRKWLSEMSNCWMYGSPSVMGTTTRGSSPEKEFPCNQTLDWTSSTW